MIVSGDRATRYRFTYTEQCMWNYRQPGLPENRGCLSIDRNYSLNDELGLEVVPIRCGINAGQFKTSCVVSCLQRTEAVDVKSTDREPPRLSFARAGNALGFFRMRELINRTTGSGLRFEKEKIREEIVGCVRIFIPVIAGCAEC